MYIRTRYSIGQMVWIVYRDADRKHKTVQVKINGINVFKLAKEKPIIYYTFEEWYNRTEDQIFPDLISVHEYLKEKKLL